MEVQEPAGVKVAEASPPRRKSRSKGSVRCRGLTVCQHRCKKSKVNGKHYCSTHAKRYQFTRPEACAICTVELEETVRPTKCGHYFHAECLAKWLSTKQTCPTCRCTLRDAPSQAAATWVIPPVSANDGRVVSVEETLDAVFEGLVRFLRAARAGERR